MYICSIKKGFAAGSNHKNFAMHCRSRVARCLLRYRGILKITRNPLVVKSEVKNFMQYFTDFTQNDKNEENCWFLGKSSLTWAFFDAYQLYTVHRPLRSCQTFIRIRSDLNLQFEYCALGRSLGHFWEKITQWHFHSTSKEDIWPKKFKFHAGVKKCHFGNFSERAGMAVPC